MKLDKKVLSLLLAFFMVFSCFADIIPIAAESLPREESEELVGVKKGDKIEFAFEIPQNASAQGSAYIADDGLEVSDYDFEAQRAGQTDTIIELKTNGLNKAEFDWSTLPNSDFNLIAKWNTTDGQSHEKIIGPITKDGTREFNVGWPVDGTLTGNAVLQSQYDQNIGIRVKFTPANGIGGSGKLKFTVTLTELAEPRAEVKYVDPYGRELTDPADLPIGTMPKVTAPELTDVEIDLPNSSQQINMRSSDDIDEDELNGAANGLTFKVDGKTTGETVTIDNKEYKLDISQPNAKQIGTIKMVYQKDVLVPPTKDDGSGEPVDPAEGYVRLTFDANEKKQDGITGKHNAGLYAGKQKSYIDVKQGVNYDNANLQNAIKELATTGTKEVNGETKTFGQDAKKPWTPTVPTDTTPVAEATYNAQYTKSAAEQVTELGGLKPVTIKVWKGDNIDWTKGVAPATTNTDDAAVVNSLLANAEVTDKTQPARTSAEAGKKEGTLLVTFGDGSTLTVDHQWLYVWEHIVKIDPTDPNSPSVDDLPDDKIEVRFLKSTGVQTINTTGKTYAKEGTVFQDTDFPQDITFKDGYKGPVTWIPKDRKVTTSSKAYDKRQGYFGFRASAGKTVIPTDPTNPDTPQGYVLVTFEKGSHGTLSGIDKDGKNVTKADKLAFNVKNTATWKDMAKYIPTAVAEGEWKVADPAWDPQIPAEGTTVTAGKYTAQYAEDKTVIPTDPTIDQPYEGDDKITGKGEPGSDIVVTDEDGNPIGKTTVDEDGNWTVDVPADKPLKPGDVIKATQTDKDGNTKDATAIVKGRYTPEPEKPYDPGHWYEPSPDYLNKNEYKPVVKDPEHRELDVFSLYMIGNDSHMFMPHKGITRAEVAQIFARALRYDGYQRRGEYNPYSDVNANAWYYDAVITTTEAGVFRGTDKGTFEPNREITKAELIATIARFQELINKDGNIFNMRPNHWARPEVEAAFQEGWLDIYTNGTVVFDADMVITRAEVASILNRAFGRHDDVNYINDNIESLVRFEDVSRDDWFYYDVIVATNTYATFGSEWINHSNGLDREFTNLDDIEWIRPLRDDKDVIESLRRVKFQRYVR